MMDPTGPDSYTRHRTTSPRRIRMRKSFVLVIAVSVACSSDSTLTENLPPGLNPTAPRNPLIALLTGEASTFTMTRLGADDTSPYRINSTVCDDLPTHTDVVDSLFFHGDGGFTRVYRSVSRVWRTNGVANPIEMNLRNKWSHKGTVSGEGDILALTTTHAQQNDEPYAPFTGTFYVRTFSISGSQFSQSETLGTGCQGQRTPTTAVFTRAE